MSSPFSLRLRVVVLLLLLGVPALWWVLMRPRAVIPPAPPTTSESKVWSPDAIQADPVGYLSWALAEARRADKRLREGMDTLRNREDQTRRLRSVNEAERQGQLRLLDNARDAYRKGEASGKWPVELRGEVQGRDDLRELILLSAARAESLEALNRSLEETARALRRNLSELEEQGLAVRRLLARLGADLEQARLREDQESLLALSNDLSGILGTIGAMSAPSGVLTLEDLALPAKEQAADETFQHLMSEAPEGKEP